jgi:hypothetical protein
VGGVVVPGSKMNILSETILFSASNKWNIIE